MPVEDTIEAAHQEARKRNFPPPPTRQKTQRKRLALSFNSQGSSDFAETTEREIRNILSQTRTPWGEPQKLGRDAVKKLETSLLDLQADLTAREEMLRYKEARVVEREREMNESVALIDARMRVVETRSASLEDRERQVAERAEEAINSQSEAVRENEDLRLRLKEAEAALAEVVDRDPSGDPNAAAASEQLQQENRDFQRRLRERENTIERLQMQLEDARSAGPAETRPSAEQESAIAEWQRRAEDAERTLAELREGPAPEAADTAETEKLREDNREIERRLRERENELEKLKLELEKRAEASAGPGSGNGTAASNAGTFEQEAIKVYLEELEQRDRSLRELRDELKERESFIEDCEDQLLQRSMELSVREAKLEQTEEDQDSDRRRMINESGSLEDEFDDLEAESGA